VRGVILSEFQTPKRRQYEKHRDGPAILFGLSGHSGTLLARRWFRLCQL